MCVEQDHLEIVFLCTDLSKETIISVVLWVLTLLIWMWGWTRTCSVHYFDSFGEVDNRVPTNMPYVLGSGIMCMVGHCSLKESVTGYPRLMVPPLEAHKDCHC